MTLLQAALLEPILPGPQVLIALAQRRRQQQLALGAVPGSTFRYAPWTGLAMLGVAIYVLWRLARPAKSAIYWSRRLNRNPGKRVLEPEEIRDMRARKQEIRREIYATSDDDSLSPQEAKRRIGKLYMESDMIDALIKAHFES